MSKTLPFCVDIWRMVASDCDIFTVVALGATCHHLQRCMRPQWAQWQAMASRPERGIKVAAAAIRPDLVRVFQARGAQDVGAAMSCALECGDLKWFSKLFTEVDDLEGLSEELCAAAISHRVTALCTAARVNHDVFKDNLWRWRFALNRDHTERLVRAVGNTGNLSLCEFLHRYTCGSNRWLLESFAGYGSIQDCQSLLQLTLPCCCNLLDLCLVHSITTCLMQDNVQVFPFLWERLCHVARKEEQVISSHLYGNMIQWAAQHGRREIIETIVKDYKQILSATGQLNVQVWDGLTVGCYQGRHLDLLDEYARRWRFEPEWASKISGAIAGGHLDLLQSSLVGLQRKLDEYGRVIDANTWILYLYKAAELGHAHIVDYLLQVGSFNMCDAYGPEYVALRGEYFDIVDRLVQYFHLDPAQLKGDLNCPTLQQLEYLRYLELKVDTPHELENETKKILK